MKCQKNRSCAKQNPNSLPDIRKRCTGCDKIGKDKKDKKPSLLNRIEELERRIGYLEYGTSFCYVKPVNGNKL